MVSFYYQARNRKGELVEGRLEVETEQSAINELTRRGLYIISLKLKGEAEPEELRRTKIKLKDLAQFASRLSELVSSGLPLLRALELLKVQFKDKEFGKVIHHILLKIRDGASLSESISSFDFIPPLLPSLVASGEASGNLDSSLQEASSIFEKELDLRGKVKSAMFYPLLVLALGLLTVFFLLSFVIPKIAGIFQELGQALPLITRVVVSFSNLFANFWWLFLLFGVSGYFGFKKYTSYGRGRRIWEEFKLRLPLVSKIWQQRELILFSRTLGMLLKAGVPLVKAVDLTKSVLGSERYKLKMEELIGDLEEGSSLSRGIRGFFPQEVVDIIAVGEESGNLENALLKLAQNYEKELDYQLKMATQLLEPLMILLVGLVVGAIIISVLLPIFQLNMLIR